jgi:hypothetical protein
VHECAAVCSSVQQCATVWQECGRSVQQCAAGCAAVCVQHATVCWMCISVQCASGVCIRCVHQVCASGVCIRCVHQVCASCVCLLCVFVVCGVRLCCPPLPPHPPSHMQPQPMQPPHTQPKSEQATAVPAKAHRESSWSVEDGLRRGSGAQRVTNCGLNDMLRTATKRGVNPSKGDCT